MPFINLSLQMNFDIGEVFTCGVYLTVKITKNT